MGRGGLETGGCGGERGMRGAQSTQSAPYLYLFIQSEGGGGEAPPKKS